MIVQGFQYHELGGDPLGYFIIAVVGVALIALARAKQPRTSAAGA
jgi:hypothetical protein